MARRKGFLSETVGRQLDLKPEVRKYNRHACYLPLVLIVIARWEH